MTDTDRLQREGEFKDSFERQLPEFADMCSQAVDEIIFHQDAFAADYQDSEFCLLGRAIKYAGLLGKPVRIIGRNAQTVRSDALLSDRPQ